MHISFEQGFSGFRKPQIALENECSKGRRAWFRLKARLPDLASVPGYAPFV